jgi:DNA-directed RNA polymerase subunit K/omega
VVHRPADTNPFEFIVVASLRAAQLMRGCTPLVEPASRIITTAQLEVAAGKIARIPPVVLPIAE